MTDAYTIKGVRYRSAYDRSGKKKKRSPPAELDTAGETLLTSAKNLITQYDPNGTFLKFAFVTDLHRSEEGVYDSNAIDDRPSLRLLSRLCDEVDIDAVFCGGDITNARNENSQYFVQNMEDVVGDFDDLLPYTNVFATIGNHDKRYSTSRTNNTNSWLKSLYAHLQQDGRGVTVEYVDDTNFYVDFPKHKVRIIFINQYDGVDADSSYYANENISSDTGIHTRGTTEWKAALDIEDDEDWLVGVVFHGADNSNPSNPNVSYFNFTDLSTTLKGYVDDGGKGVIGAFAGHYHSAQYRTIQPCPNLIHVNRAYATSGQLETANAYCFSVIVLDPTTGIFNELRIGRAADQIPFCAYPSANGGLLQNGTSGVYASTTVPFCVMNGKRVRFNRRENAYCEGINLTDITKNTSSGGGRADYVTGDTANVLFSVESGDVLKTELIFSEDSGTGRKIKVFSPQISNMLTVDPYTPGHTYTKEITFTESKDITAIGVYWYGNTNENPRQVLDFELNVYKNGVKLTRTEADE